MKLETPFVSKSDFPEANYFKFNLQSLKRSEEKSFFRVYILFSILSIFILHFFLTLKAPLIGDEAYYWLWSKHLSLGYHDHPPLIGWMIALTSKFSSRLFFIRLPAVLCFLGSTAFFYWFSRDVLGSKKKALLSLLLFLYMPILAISSVAVFPDTALILAWVISLWAGWKSLKDGRYWLLTGFAVGFALISKLIGLFLVLSFALFFLVNTNARFWLRKKIFWGGVGIAVSVSLPLWVWNLQHGFENFVFQAHDHLSNHPPFPVLSFLAYNGVQALSVSPVLFFFLILTSISLAKRSFQGESSAQYLLAFSLPIHVIFGILPFWARVGFHWAAPGYISLLVAAVEFQFLKKWLYPSLMSAMFMTFLFFFILLFPVTIAKWVAPLDQRYPQWGIPSFLQGKGYGEILGYEKLSRLVESKIENFKKAGPVFVLTDSYTLSSGIAYYSKKTTCTFLPTGQGGEYARWHDFRKFERQNALWVGLFPLAEQPAENEILEKAFDRIEKTELVQVQDGPVTRNFYLTRLYDLKHPELLRSSHPDVPH